MPRPIAVVLFLMWSCQPKDANVVEGQYGYDLDFLNKYDDTTIELTDESGNSRIILSPRYQGRVMTSTSTGKTGASYGWINYPLISSQEVRKQFNPVGGEERFWLGPEGGQFSLYFAPKDSFNIKYWQVPPSIDTVSYSLVEKSDTSANFRTEARLTNFSGTIFNIRIDRSVRLLGKADLQREFGAIIGDDVKFVGYQTTNTITNAGQQQWQKETGLISIWLLGMFTPSPSTTVIIPFLAGSEDQINTDYFGDIPADRLDIREGFLLFRCDGRHRSKIGLPPSISSPIAASYDPDKNILTVIRFGIDRDGDYVNSKWEMQEQPFSGDVVNSYNDGPLADGSQLGPFFELESSSAALPLLPGERQTHRQVTAHFEGDREALRSLAMSLLGVDLNTIK